jgi:hypothetical protein
MSQQRNSPSSFVAGEALGQYRRVRLNNAGQVEYSDAADYGIGIVQNTVASGSHATVRSYEHGGSHQMVASAAVVINKLVYAAADGKVAPTGTLVIGTAKEAASGDNSVFEVWPHVGRALQSSSSSSSSSST